MAFALSFVNRRVRIISGNKKEVMFTYGGGGRRTRFGCTLAAVCLFLFLEVRVSISTLNQKRTAQISVP